MLKLCATTLTLKNHAFENVNKQLEVRKSPTLSGQYPIFFSRKSHWTAFLSSSSAVPEFRASIFRSLRTLLWGEFSLEILGKNIWEMECEKTLKGFITSREKLNQAKKLWRNLLFSLYPSEEARQKESLVEISTFLTSIWEQLYII